MSQNKPISLAARVASHLPGGTPLARQSHTTRPAGSPQATPRTERDQPILSSPEPTGTGATASTTHRAASPQPSRKAPNRAATIDNTSSEGRGPLPQAQAQPRVQPQAQPQAQPSAHSPQLPPPPPSIPRAQQTQPHASTPNPRTSTEYPAPQASRPQDGRSVGHEKNHHQREEPHQRELDGIDAYFHKQKTRLDKRQAAIEATYAHIKQREDNLTSLEEKVRYFESEPYRDEVLSIRKHMQINDMQEVSAISEKFRRITRTVEDISRDLGEKLSDSQAVRELKTTDLVKLVINRSLAKQPAKGTVPPFPMDPEDFIDFGCRALLNDWLVERICGPNIFHPALVGRPENDLFLNTYQRVRNQESQTIAGRWRVSTFNTVEPHGCDAQAIAHEFCQNALTPLCEYVYKLEACTEPIHAAFGAITELFKSAVSWTSLSKTSVVMFDFQPYFAPPGSSFVPTFAQLEGPGKHLPGPEGIMLTSKLGLYSSRTQGSQGLDRTTQIPAKVLTAQYFS